MVRKRRPSGRENIVAGSMLETMREQETREKDVALSSVLSGMAEWRGARRGVIRLINLERRARFARLSFETN
jgi:hypothetical protein